MQVSIAKSIDWNPYTGHSREDFYAYVAVYMCLAAVGLAILVINRVGADPPYLWAVGMITCLVRARQAHVRDCVAARKGASTLRGLRAPWHEQRARRRLASCATAACTCPLPCRRKPTRLATRSSTTGARYAVLKKELLCQEFCPHTQRAALLQDALLTRP